MSIIDAGMGRARTVIASLLLLLVAGTVAFISIPKEAEPDVNVPIIYVSMHHDGISPEDAERLLVRPVESELRSIEGVKEMRSTSFQGGGNVLLEFEAGFDADQALADVREQVDIAKPELPDDTDEPTVNEVNISLFPILRVNLSGPVPERTLVRLARDLQDKVEGIPTVLEAKIGGDREEQVEIVVEPEAIESYGLDAAEVIELLTRSNQLVAAGAVDTGRGRFPIKVPGLFETVDDILDMPVKLNGDAVVRMRDIAQVQRTFKDRETLARANGLPAIALEISKRTGSNIIETVERVRAVVETERMNWPQSISVTYSQDKSQRVRDMLSDLQNNVLSAVLLVMIAVVGALGLRSGILVAIAIPGSFLTGMLVLSMLGLTVNIVVLFSLILAVGMLVDGAIVVTEYADRMRQEGEPFERAYALAARRMAWPIIASTATTLAAFAPLLFWPGLSGEFMKFLPITLIATLSASLLMALIFVPVLGANFGTVARIVVVLLTTAGLGAGAAVAAHTVVSTLLGIDPGPMLAAPVALAGIAGAILGVRLGLWLGNRVYRALTAPPPTGSQSALSDDSSADLSTIRGGTGLYLAVLRRALAMPGIVVAIAVVMLIGSWVLYSALGKGIEFFPTVEPEQAAIQIHARGNLSVDEKVELVREVEQRVLEFNAETGEIASVYMEAGNLPTRDDEAEDIVGTVQLEFADWSKRRPADDILADIFERSADLAGILVETRKEQGGPPTGKPVQVQLSSSFPALLDAEITRVRDYVNTMEGLKDIEDSRPMPGIEWQLAVDRVQAAKFGADVQVIGNAIKFVTNGMKVTAYRPDDSDDEIDIIARYPRSDRTIEQLDDVRVQTQQGMVPISNFVTRTAQQRTGTLHRVDAVRVMTVKADVLPGVLADDKVSEIRAWLEQANIDPRVAVTFKGEDEEQQAAQSFLQKAFAVALFLMALILVTQFNSFYSAALILSAVIMSTVGVMLGLLIIGQPFSIVMSGIGVIALAGIVVNNNIVLIDTYDRLRTRIDEPMRAILLTGAQRLRPVMLTTVTTILGLMPMVLQLNIDFVTREVSQGAPSTQWWVQLATAIAAGLTFATILTLLITPCALMLRENFLARRQARNDVAPHHAPDPQAAE